jgi:hypothetical protein
MAAGMAIALVSTMMLAACGGSSGQSQSNADLLKSAAANMKAAKSYHLTIDVNANGQPVKIDGDFDVANNNSKLTIDNAGQKAAVTTVGSDAYISTDGGATFTKLDAATASSITSSFGQFTTMWNTFKPEQVDAVKDRITDGNPATETISGASTKHMSGSLQDLGSLSASGTTTETGTLDLWVSTDATPYVYQAKINSTSSQAMLNWSNFNKVPAITAPPTSALLPIEAYR